MIFNEDEIFLSTINVEIFLTENLSKMLIYLAAKESIRFSFFLAQVCNYVLIDVYQSQFPE